MNNKNNISYDTKPGGKDFINIGIFTVIFLILFMVGIMVMSMSIYTLPFGVALGSFIGAPVYMLLRSKAPKRFVIILFGILFGLVMFAMGSGWPILACVVFGAVLAELISGSGHYQSYINETVGYCVLMVSTACGSYMPFIFMRDYYLKLSEKNSIDGKFMASLLKFINGPYITLALAVTAVISVLGAIVARTIIKKHLVKAGIVRETK